MVSVNLNELLCILQSYVAFLKQLLQFCHYVHASVERESAVLFCLCIGRLALHGKCLSPVVNGGAFHGIFWSDCKEVRFFNG